MTNDPLAWLADEAARRDASGLVRSLVASDGAWPGRIVRDGRECLHFGSNDYLGLAADPRLAEAAARAARLHGWGAGASALVAGWTAAHRDLAEDLAAFEQAEAAALFHSGFAANLGTIAALAGPGDVVYNDRLNHACLIDGTRLSGATLRVYPHGDADRLATALRRDRGRFRRVLIATDGVFSMDGDLGPLAALVELAEQFGAILLVDEAHGTGVFGDDGRGAASLAGVADRVHVRIGTMSKALGSIGGFVVGSRKLIDHLIHHARTLVYSTSLPAPAAAAAREALAIVAAEPWRRSRVLSLADRLRSGLSANGLQPGGTFGPIVPVIVGDARLAVESARRLEGRGIFAPAIRPPTVPHGTARLRLSVTAAHTESDIDRLVDALAGLRISAA